MARKFLTPIDLSGLELRNFAIQNLTAAPSTVKGALYFDSNIGVNNLKFWDGSNWLTISTSGGTVTSVSGTANRISATGTTSVTLDLISGYGDNLNPYTTKTNNYVLAGAASGAATAPTFRALDKADIPSTLNATTFGGNISLGSTNGTNGYNITGLNNPTNAYDAVNKSYVDTIATGINAHDAVSYASTANISGTYSNGTSGVGATLTGTGSIVIDGYTVVSGDAGTNVSGGTALRLLLKDQTNSDQNGIYAVTACVSGTSWTLTRAYDYDSIGEVSAGDFAFVTLGTANSKFSFVQTSKPVAISGVGTSANAITFSVFANGNLSGTVAVNQGGTGATSFTSGGILRGNGTSALSVASGADITTAIGSSAVSKATNIVGGVLGSVPYQSVVDSTLFVSPNTTTTKKFLRQTGDGTNSAAPAWDTLVYSDLPTSSLTSVTTTGIARKTTGTLTANSSTTAFSINHQYGQWVTAQLFDASGNMVDVDVQNTATNNGTTIFTFTVAPTTGTDYKYVIVG